MEVLQIFGLWDQEIDLWFMNNKPLIPALVRRSAVDQEDLKPY